MSFSIDELCISLAYRKNGGPNQVNDGLDGPQESYGATDSESSADYQVEWQIFGLTQFQDLIAHLGTYKLSRAFDWTPPDAVGASAIKVKFVDFAVKVSGAYHWIVTATLRYLPGVA